STPNFHQKEEAMYLRVRSQGLALLFVGSLVAGANPATAGEIPWDKGNLIDNGHFEASETAELPDGWTVVAPNQALGPQFALVRDSGGTRLSAAGNGRDECFGFIKHPVRLEGGKTYRLRVRFKVQGLEDPNRHLVHAIFGHGFNEGIFEYRREGEWIIGERSFTGPTGDVNADLRLCFRYSADGKVVWDWVSLQDREP